MNCQDGNGVVRGNYLSVFLELSAGLPETSKYVYPDICFMTSIYVLLIIIVGMWKLVLRLFVAMNRLLARTIHYISIV